MEYKHNIIPDTFGRHIVRLVLLLFGLSNRRTWALDCQRSGARRRREKYIVSYIFICI